MEILLIIISILFIISIYIVINLLRKNEKLEDLAKYYADLFILMDEMINKSDQRIQEIDEKGLFKADDEIGWFFEQIKHIQDVFNKFKQNIDGKEN